MVSTAEDYVRFAQMLLNGGELDQVRLLSPRTVSFMTSDHLWPGVAFSPVTLNLFEPLGIAPTPKVGQGFGLGFVVRTQEGRNPMPGSPGEYFWAGIWGTAFWVDAIETLTLSDTQFLKGDTNGKATTTSGEFRIAAGSGRLPVVVLQHGSGGLGANIEMWERELNAIGVSTFALDGFTGRGLRR